MTMNVLLALIERVTSRACLHVENHRGMYIVTMIHEPEREGTVGAVLEDTFEGPDLTRILVDANRLIESRQ